MTEQNPAKGAGPSAPEHSTARSCGHALHGCPQGRETCDPTQKGFIHTQC